MSAENQHRDPELHEALEALMDLHQISTLKEFAHQSDCALSHLSTTFRGGATMSAQLIQRICGAFGLNRSEFFRMGEMRHRVNQEIAQMVEDGYEGKDVEYAARKYLEALRSEDPEGVRRLVAEYTGSGEKGPSKTNPHETD